MPRIEPIIRYGNKLTRYPQYTDKTNVFCVRLKVNYTIEVRMMLNPCLGINIHKITHLIDLCYAVFVYWLSAV